MTIEWNKVTWYSKLLALVVFLITFGIAFNLGVYWEQIHIETALTETSGVVRGNTNQYLPVSTSTPPSVSSGSLGAHCGGFIRNAPTCAAGLHCKLGVIADKGGVCVKD